uniref:IQ motif containing with AAA domain 1 n=1 Tax=Nothobranchius furzeri TaxID=105023 RepID=A0A8C6Q9D6_NOTFU
GSNILMSYDQLWADAQSELSRLLEEELPAEPVSPNKDRVVFFQHLATLYVRYIQVFRQLEVVYDQMVHPQKRRVVREILDGVMGRVLELKNEMVEKEFSEYHYMDDVLHALKLTPEEVEVPIPRYFLNECSKEVQERKGMLMEILKTPITIKEMTQEEAIRIIQRAERARQGRLRANFIERTRYRPKHFRSDDRESAAIYIQKMWRGALVRKKIKIAQYEEMIWLGMIMDPKHPVPCPAEIAVQATEACTRIKQKEYEEAYHKSAEDITNQLRKREGHDMSNAQKSQIRQWFHRCRESTGVFPDYPDEEEGGSALIFTEMHLMEEIAAKEESNQRSQWKGTVEHKQKKDKGKETEKVRIQPANIEKYIYMYIYITHTHTLFYLYIYIYIYIYVCVYVCTHKKKGSKSGKKKKKDKDLTADRTLESLCQELVKQGLLKQAKNIRLQDYLGDYSYLGSTLRQNDIEPMPSLSDVRQVLTLFAVLPLGSQVVHEKAPLIKAMLLVGPSGVGKKMLVHAVCQETGATLFDLSPLNTAGKYPGKSGLALMLQMVFKVAKLMQPSVIWIGDAEKMFYKKVPREEKELDPKRLKKDLPKLLKLIKGEDRILIIGTTKDPANADIKLLSKMYTKIVLIPRPDYGSRYILWKKLIRNEGGEITEALNLSCLAKISDGYTSGHIVQAVQSVVTKGRILLQGKRPLTADEFVTSLAKIDPVFQKEEEALKNWYAKTPLGRKRIRAATGREEEAPPPQLKAAEKKGKN